MKKILVVDDSPVFCRLIHDQLTDVGYKVRSAMDGASAVSNAIRFQPDLILLDIELPEANGLEVLSKIRDYESMKHTPVIMISSHREKETVLRAVKNGANDYIVKPINVGVLLAKVSEWINATNEQQWKLLPVRQQSALGLLKVSMASALGSAVKGRGLPYQELKNACRGLMEAIEEDGFSGMLKSLEDHENTLFLHSLIVSIYMYLFSVFKGFSEEECLLNMLGGLLHDIGNVKIPNEILFKPGELDDKEFEQARMHVEYGMDILKATQSVDQIVEDICRSHHEKMDGTGYPGGIGEEQLSASGRMIAIVEAYATLTIKNVYGKMHDKKEALLKLRAPDEHLDQQMLKEFEDAVLHGFLRGK